MRVLIAGGGTGGHIIPALAVAHELVARHAAEVLFVGTARGMEIRLVPEAGFRLRLVDVGPLKNVSLVTRLRTLLGLPRSVVACRRLIREFKPSVVFGVGGYASGPGMAAALQLKVPAMAFEPNAVPGLANRLVGKRVQAAAVNFPSAAAWFRNAEVTGIPVRPEFFTLEVARRGRAPSAGLRRFAGRAPLQQGVCRRWFRRCWMRFPASPSFIRAAYVMPSRPRPPMPPLEPIPSGGRCTPFLDDMPARFAQASLVMARSGASTVAELAAAGKPSLLVPFAAAADDHQKRNAEEMVNAGAAVMLHEWDLDVSGKLLEALKALLTAPERLASMAAAARTQAHPGAAERIADRLAASPRRRQPRQVRQQDGSPERVQARCLDGDSARALDLHILKAKKRPACRSRRAF